ncbi:MAG TPA: TauD/TfdA family dioxygenase [Steroidobacteraceae bacterium]
MPEAFTTVIKGGGESSASAWIAANKERVIQSLEASGAVLIRGFRSWTESDFRVVVNVIGGEEPLEYVYRSTPRTDLGRGVYTATEYPPGLSIPLHNENAYQRDWPMLLFFFGAHPAEGGGGQTTLADMAKVTARIDPSIRARFEEKKVMYIRNYRKDVDLPWSVVFQSDSRQDVEKYCASHDIKFEWTPEGHLRTRQVCDALSVHPRTGQWIWFNQAHLFHPSSMDERTRQALRSMFKDEDLPRNATYGDGSAIEESALEEIREAFRKETVGVQWHKGDVLILDNMLVSHGRSPYKGKRKILVAMARPFSSCVNSDVLDEPLPSGG